MSKNAKYNTLTALLLQITTAISGLILPQLFIRTYGSSMNGMVTSVTQFISYLSLVEAGIGAGSIVALYRPLANDDDSLISKILSTTKDFYRKSGIIFILLLLVLTVVYPLITSNQVDKGTTTWMIIILSLSAMCDYFIIGKYRVLLTADQKLYVIHFWQILGTIANILVTVFLVYFKYDIVVVKGLSTLIYIARFIFVVCYVRKNYKNINFCEEPDPGLINQKWDAFIHQIAGLIVVNSGIVLLTIFGYDFKEISVFTIYNMIINVLNNLLMSFYNALTPIFGRIYARDNKNQLLKSFDIYEGLFFVLVFSVSACFLFLVLPFVNLYISGVSDVNYIRPEYAITGAGVILAFNLYDPAMTIINGAGHYQQTRNYSIICSIINIIVSVFAIIIFGPVGIFIAEIFSQLYIDFAFIIYNGKNIAINSLRKTFFRLLLFGSLFLLSIFLYTMHLTFNTNNYLQWFLLAALTFVLTLLINFFGLCFFEKDFLKKMLGNKRHIKELKK